MAYNFKRLTEVEELAEAPENAKVLAVVDGTVKRVPAGGGGGNANLEDIMFDLDIDMPSWNQLSFTNADQVRKAFDNKMYINVVYMGDYSGTFLSYYVKIYCDVEYLNVEDVSGKTVVTISAYDTYGHKTLTVDIDPDEYDRGNIVITGAMLNVSGTVVRAYASII